MAKDKMAGVVFIIRVGNDEVWCPQACAMRMIVEIGRDVCPDQNVKVLTFGIEEGATKENVSFFAETFGSQGYTTIHFGYPTEGGDGVLSELAKAVKSLRGGVEVLALLVSEGLPGIHQHLEAMGEDTEGCIYPGHFRTFYFPHQ